MINSLVLQIKSINDIIILILTISVLLILIIVIVLPGLRKNELCSKMVGSLFLIIVAMASNDNYVYIICVFFIGLIIASERFSLILAALVRAPKEFLQSDSFGNLINYGISTKEEAEKKIEEEVEEQQSVQEKTPLERKNFRETIKKISDSEDKILNYIENQYGILDRRITINNKAGSSLNLDAALRGTRHFFEIRSIGSLINGKIPDKMLLKYSLERNLVNILFKIQGIFEGTPVVLDVYLPHKLNLEDFSKLEEFIHDFILRNPIPKNIRLRIIPFNLKKIGE